MALEAINSTMSLQAQMVPTVKAPAPVEKIQETPQVGIEPSKKVDQTTKVVENTQSKGQENTTADNAQQEEQEHITPAEQVRRVVENLNKFKLANSEAVFGIHDGTHRVTIKIVDKKTTEVIKELPPEKTLDMIAKVWEIAGILVDEKR